MKTKKKKKLYRRYLEGEQRKIAGKQRKYKKAAEDIDNYGGW